LEHGERPFQLILQALALKRSVELLMQFAQALHRPQQNVIIQVVRDDASLQAVQDFLQLAQDLKGREVGDVTHYRNLPDRGSPTAGGSPRRSGVAVGGSKARSGTAEREIP